VNRPGRRLDAIRKAITAQMAALGDRPRAGESAHRIVFDYARHRLDRVLTRIRSTTPMPYVETRDSPRYRSGVRWTSRPYAGPKLQPQPRIRVYSADPADVVSQRPGGGGEPSGGVYAAILDELDVVAPADRYPPSS